MLLPLLIASLAATAPLRPAGKWVVSYNPADCTLQRTFGEATKLTVFGFKPAPTQMSGDLVLLVPGGANPGRGKGTVTLEPSGTRYTVDWARGPLKGDRHGYRMWVEKPFWDALPSAELIRFDIGEPAPIAAALGPMQAAFAAVKACGDDLLRSWGADPARLVQLEQPDTAARWFSASEYPAGAIAAGEEGRVSTLTLVDASGAPLKCTVVATSGSAALDQRTCSIIMRRARMKEVGNSSETRFFFLPVRWALPIG